ncbi:MAG: dihydroneopterin aldolase [Bacteroidia bacterium]|nr:dihydroneopterin aldolase [Bacteroidia bacterium]
MNGIIQLEGMEFYAFHGCYKEEQVVGSKFMVDVSITTNCEKAVKTDSIKDALNYQAVYEIIKKEMSVKSHLLEHVAGRILDSLFAKFETIQNAAIKIAKVNPPVGGQVGKVSITLMR